MEQLHRLNQFRLDADSKCKDLERIRERHMNSLSRFDSKMDEYHKYDQCATSGNALNYRKQ